MSGSERLIRIWERLKVYHVYYRRSGLYRFMLVNGLKVSVFLGLFILAFYLIETYIIEFETLFEEMLEHLSEWQVLIIFFFSESVIGLLPPDLLVLWAQHTFNPWLIVSGLAITSYLGGYAAFGIGQLLYLQPRIQQYITRKFSNYIGLFKKWGGILIILAALFPLPWGVVASIAGILRFPAVRFLSFALVRIARFYLYALLFFRIF